MELFSISPVIISKNGIKRLENNQNRFAILNEAFGGVKEVKAGGLEQIILRGFQSLLKYLLKPASAQVIAQLPRFMLEAIL